jgi:hypothetical protein
MFYMQWYYYLKLLIVDCLYMQKGLLLHFRHIEKYMHYLQ